MKKYFLIIQPDNFKKPKKVERIIIFDKDKALIFDCEMTRISYMYIKKLMSENALFITYNGELLKNMLWQFFGFCEYKNIIDLMA